MRFVNFWAGFDYEGEAANPSPWTELLFDSFRNCDLLIGSVFGHSEEILDVLFSGECVWGLRHDGEHFVFLDHKTGKEGRAKWFMGIPKLDHPRAL